MFFLLVGFVAWGGAGIWWNSWERCERCSTHLVFRERSRKGKVNSSMNTTNLQLFGFEPKAITVNLNKKKLTVCRWWIKVCRKKKDDISVLFNKERVLLICCHCQPGWLEKASQHALFQLGDLEKTQHGWENWIDVFVHVWLLWYLDKFRFFSSSMCRNECFILKKNWLHFGKRIPIHGKTFGPSPHKHLTLMLAALKTPRGWKAAEVSENGMTCETPYIFEAENAGFRGEELLNLWKKSPHGGNKMGDKTDSSVFDRKGLSS